MPKDPLISQAEVKARFDYDPKSGIFTDKTTGKKAGSPNAKNYLYVRIGGRSVGLHRLVFMWMYGHWPVEHVDHINSCPWDNRLVNLRPATASQNAQNRRPTDKNYGYKGVVRNKVTGRWHAKITVDGRRKCLPGSYESAYRAHQAYKAAAREYHRDFARYENIHPDPSVRLGPIDKPQITRDWLRIDV